MTRFSCCRSDRASRKIPSATKAMLGATRRGTAKGCRRWWRVCLQTGRGSRQTSGSGSTPVPSTGRRDLSILPAATPTRAKAKQANGRANRRWNSMASRSVAVPARTRSHSSRSRGLRHGQEPEGVWAGRSIAIVVDEKPEILYLSASFLSTLMLAAVDQRQLKASIRIRCER